MSIKPCTPRFRRIAELGTTAFVLFAIAGCSNGKREPVATPEESGAVEAAAAPEPKERIEGPAGTLYINDGGWGGTPVVFVHSFGANSSFWDPQLQHLRRTRRAIAIDLRGHGQSDTASTGEYSIAGFAKDIEAVADSLGLKRFVLVGHEVGGAAAVTFAGTHPERVAGLVLVGTPGKTSPEVADSVIALLESEQYQKTMDDYLAQLLVNATPNVTTRVKTAYVAIPRERNIMVTKSLFAYDPTEPLKLYTGPALAITLTGQPDDPMAIHRLSATVVHKEMGGVSHWMYLDKPDEFNVLLDGFLVTVK